MKRKKHYYFNGLAVGTFFFILCLQTEYIFDNHYRISVNGFLNLNL